MRKPAFCIFYGLCILISFTLLTITVQGVLNKHCLLLFFYSLFYHCFHSSHINEMSLYVFFK